MIERRMALPDGEVAVEMLLSRPAPEAAQLDTGRSVGRMILARALQHGEDFTALSDPDAFETYRHMLSEQIDIDLPPTITLGKVVNLQPVGGGGPLQETGGSVHTLRGPGIPPLVSLTGDEILGDVQLHGTEATAEGDTENDYALTIHLLGSGAMELDGTMNIGDPQHGNHLLKTWYQLGLQETIPVTPETGLDISNEPLTLEQMYALAAHVEQRTAIS